MSLTVSLRGKRANSFKKPCIFGFFGSQRLRMEIRKIPEAAKKLAAAERRFGPDFPWQITRWHLGAF
jgi:hypothetical protein